MGKQLIKETLRNQLKAILLRESMSGSFVPRETLTRILTGYLDCALWTEEERLNSDYEEEHPNPDSDFESNDNDNDVDNMVHKQSQIKDFASFTLDNLEDDSKIQAYLDIKNFALNAGQEAVGEALRENGPEQLGHDIWLTRNHHGAGFFDRGYDYESQLTVAAQNLKEVDMYLSDSGWLVFSNSI